MTGRALNMSTYSQRFSCGMNGEKQGEQLVVHQKTAIKTELTNGGR